MRFPTDYPTPRPGWLSATAITAAMLTLVLMAPGAARAASGQDIGIETHSVAVRPIDRSPTSKAQARRLLTRLGDAALEVCGASGFSAASIKLTVRRSQCWKDSMARAVADIANPDVATLYERGTFADKSG